MDSLHILMHFFEIPDAFSMEELAYVLEEKTGVNDVNDEISSTFKLFDANSKGYIDFEDLKRISVELGENLKDEEIRVIHLAFS